MRIGKSSRPRVYQHAEKLNLRLAYKHESGTLHAEGKKCWALTGRRTPMPCAGAAGVWRHPFKTRTTLCPHGESAGLAIRKGGK